ncbi:hypothetical protein ACIPRI_05345 [Variovorax sp. LARHSF232]
MVHRDFRAQFEVADWDVLRLCSALACHDASLCDADDESLRWARLAGLLRQIGQRAAGAEGERDLALRVLADFADEAACDEAVARVRALDAECFAPGLRAITERAVAVVDRVCPEQAFRFRATLVLLSMLVEPPNWH